MSTELIYVIIGIITLVVGLFAGMYIQKLKTKSTESVWGEREQQFNATIKSLNDKLLQSDEEQKQLQHEKEQQSNQLVRYQADLENLQLKNKEQKEEVEKLQEKFTKEFENLANKILDEKSEKFTKSNKENIENILTPLNKKIKEFEEKVEKSQKENISIHSALKEQLLTLQTQNLKITQEAENLTKALKGDSKMQGNWGELVLERVLEKSGLEKDREYSVQQSFKRTDGTRVLPDVIIHLPDGKKMVVDSKVSLTDYERYTNAEEEDRPKFLKDHINSLRRHVEQLSAKKYEDLYEMESPDFVLMFVPIEPAFAVAINEDVSLYNKAFEQNIVIVTPSTLLATLRTIDSMWSNEKQQRNAMEIARQAGGLYDKFVGLINDLDSVGKSIKKSQDFYVGAMKKLSEGDGNLVRRVEKLKKMGAKAKKDMPENYLKRAQKDDFEELN
ncbi:RmuC-domain protein [Allomuricauda ruestringensis DSM 13258]|uniref:RmuC-domain protein n=1 Tax=Allomuricauda ruestringensis (strain DSM 13258 / CIP 107369 / LMG 19739 / B1) TaxID=886377 RepID=G2PMH4_ALLRU|nr:DNA recombination protein RmuC [Allomuricauda ruestringensis]AEM72307.1 RmuC-domain protein [Allomuricauda ruestringensis DSM 13258]